MGRTLGETFGEPPRVEISSSLAKERTPSPVRLVGLDRPDRAVASASSFRSASNSRSNLLAMLNEVFT
jgi:hypothetical protein